jgi:hypothetical protein
VQYYRDLMFSVIADLSEDAAREVKERLCYRYHEDVAAHWRGISASAPVHDLETLRALMFNPEDERHGFRYVLDEATPGVLVVRVTQCPLFQVLKEKGIPDLTFPMFCAADEIRVREFDRAVRLERPELLSQGGNQCVFRLSVGARP